MEDPTEINNETNDDYANVENYEDYNLDKEANNNDATNTNETQSKDANVEKIEKARNYLLEQISNSNTIDEKAVQYYGYFDNLINKKNTENITPDALAYLKQLEPEIAKAEEKYNDYRKKVEKMDKYKLSPFISVAASYLSKGKTLFGNKAKDAKMCKYFDQLLGSGNINDIIDNMEALQYLYEGFIALSLENPDICNDDLWQTLKNIYEKCLQSNVKSILSLAEHNKINGLQCNFVRILAETADNNNMSQWEYNDILSCLRTNLYKLLNGQQDSIQNAGYLQNLLQAICNEYYKESISFSQCNALLNYLLYTALEYAIHQYTIQPFSNVSQFINRLLIDMSSGTRIQCVLIRDILDYMCIVVSEQHNDNIIETYVYDIITKYIRKLVFEFCTDGEKDDIEMEYLNKYKIIKSFLGINIFNKLSTDNFSKLLNTNVEVLNKMDNNCSDAQKYFSQQWVDNVRLYVYDCIKKKLHSNNTDSKYINDAIQKLISKNNEILLKNMWNKQKVDDIVQYIYSNLIYNTQDVLLGWQAHVTNMLFTLPGSAQMCKEKATLLCQQGLFDDPMKYAIEQYIFEKIIESEKLAKDIVENIKDYSKEKQGRVLGKLMSIHSKYVLKQTLGFLSNKKFARLFIKTVDNKNCGENINNENK